MVPVQQTSYVPETTYRTQYQNVPVTTYKPSCEVDPCTGCSRECMQPVTQYVQQAVNVPVTQYRAVTTTKYVQMQPGYGGGYPAAQPATAMPAMVAPAPAMAAPATSPFAAPVQTTPQGWGAAGAASSTEIFQRCRLQLFPGPGTYLKNRSGRQTGRANPPGILAYAPTRRNFRPEFCSGTSRNPIL